MSAINFFQPIETRIVVKPNMPNKTNPKKIKEVATDKKKADYISHKLMTINVHASALNHDLNILRDYGLLKGFPEIIKFKNNMKNLEEVFYSEINKNEDKMQEFRDKLRAIENISFNISQADSDTIFRTEKFIESLMAKKYK